MTNCNKCEEARRWVLSFLKSRSILHQNFPLETPKDNKIEQTKLELNSIFNKLNKL